MELAQVQAAPEREGRHGSLREERLAHLCDRPSVGESSRACA